MLIKAYLRIIDSAARGGALHVNNCILKIRYKNKGYKMGFNSQGTHMLEKNVYPECSVSRFG